MSAAVNNIDVIFVGCHADRRCYCYIRGGTAIATTTTAKNFVAETVEEVKAVAEKVKAVAEADTNKTNTNN